MDESSGLPRDGLAGGTPERIRGIGNGPITEAQALALVSLAQAGDRRAESRLVTALEPLARAKARELRNRTKLPPWIDKDDLYSAALEGVLLACRQFDGRGSFFGFARQMAAWKIGQVFNCRTVRRSALEVRGEALPDFGVTAVYCPAQEPESEFDSPAARLEAALKPLSRHQRALVESVNGLNGRPKRPMRDIAARLGTSPQGAGKLYAGALRRAAAAGAA